MLLGEPLCRHCHHHHGIIEPATELHHAVRLRDAPHLRLERSNLVPLCSACHAAETRREVAEARAKASQSG